MKLPSLSSRVEAIEPPKIKIDFAKARQKGVVSLSIGEPDFETPWIVKQAGIGAIQDNDTFYCDSSGLPELRVEIARYLFEHYALRYDPVDEILVSVGASEAIDITLRALLNEGDEVIIPEPAYNSYEPVVTLAGGKCVYVPLSEKKRFRLQAGDLLKAITPKTKALILNYPHNPTGAILEKEDLEAIAKVCIAKNIYVITDEIYSELTYGKKHVSIASLPGMAERTIYISGFSKAFAMTGWRLGYVCAPSAILSRIRKVHQYCLLASPTISQYAALEALKHGEGETEKMRNAYNLRRAYIIKSLQGMGLDCFVPEGAFYVFPSIQKTGLSSDEFVAKLFDEEKVILISGTGFGKVGEGFVRISYAYSMSQIEEGMKRIARFIEKHSK
jgi:aminotransferase